MKRIIQVVFILLILTGCVNTKRPTLKETAISLIEKSYQVDGRRLEYSQIDSSDAEFKGYSICRIYIDDSDSARMDIFHLNYKETNVDKTNSFTIDSDLYKSFISKGKVFTDDLHDDLERINIAHDKFYGVEMDYPINDSIRAADSIACVEAAAAINN